MFELQASVMVLILGLGLCCLALIAIIVVLYMKLSPSGRKEPKADESEIRRIYFEIHESLQEAIAGGNRFRHCAAEYNNSITGKFGISRLVIYVYSRNRYNPIIWHNIEFKGINKLFFAAGSETAKKLSTTGQPISFDQEPPHGNIGRLMYEKVGLKYAFPIIYGKRLFGLVLMSDSSIFPMDRLAPYILALTDQLALAYELLKRGKAQKVRLNPEPVERATDNHQQRSHIGAECPSCQPLIDANNLLLREYNIGQLLQKFLDIINRHLDPAFAFLHLPEAKHGNLMIAHATNNLPGQLSNHRIKPGDALVKILSRDHGVHRMKHIEEVIGLEPTVRLLSEAGCRLIASMSLPGHQVGFLGMGEIKSQSRDYTQDEINIISSLCQTLRLTMENIHQFRKIEEMSYTDSMTGLYNYRYFYKRLGEEILRARRFERSLALVIFDIDEFKVINDSYGHQTGDFILKQLGKLMHESVRSIDIVSRYGGEEFCMIMPETDRESCAQFMERLRVKIASYSFKNRNSDESLNISVSMGGAIYPDDAPRIDRLIYCADMAMMESKKTGRNKINLYNPSFKDSGTRQD